MCLTCEIPGLQRSSKYVWISNKRYCMCSAQLGMLYDTDKSIKYDIEEKY
jgi:hypothetical protein